MLAAVGLAILVGLFLLLRPDSTSKPSNGTARIEVTNGEVSGPETITVAEGDTVSLEVTADVADEVHVHGYDLMFETSPGEKVPVQFQATIAGVFEIELEDAGLLLTRLEVTA